MSIRRTRPAAVLVPRCAAQVPPRPGPYQVTGTSRDAGSAASSAPSTPSRRAPIRSTASRWSAWPGMFRPRPARGTIVFLPPLGTTFSFYEQRDPNGALGTSIAEYFAQRNFDVYGYSPRFEGIPGGHLRGGRPRLLDHGHLGHGLEVDDITFVRSQIEILHPGTKIVTGGASLGGILALAVANAHPERLGRHHRLGGDALQQEPAGARAQPGLLRHARGPARRRAGLRRRRRPTSSRWPPSCARRPRAG